MLPPKIDESEVVVVPFVLWQQHLEKRASLGSRIRFMGLQCVSRKRAKTGAQVYGLVVSAQQVVTDNEQLKQHVCRLVDDLKTACETSCQQTHLRCCWGCSEVISPRKTYVS